MLSKDSKLYDIINGRKYKKCKEHQIRNPITKRCVNIKPLKECPEGKVLNPKTNRCVFIDGPIGKELLNKKSINNPIKVYKKESIKKPIISPDREKKAKYLLKKIFNKKKDKELIDIYKDTEYKDICENYTKFINYKTNVKVTKLKYTLNYNLYKYTDDNILVTYVKNDIEIYYTDKNKSFILELYENLKDIDKINNIIRESDNYINLLSRNKKNILKYFNNSIYIIINKYLSDEKGFTIEWLHDYIDSNNFLFVFGNKSNKTIYTFQEEIYNYYIINNPSIGETWKSENILKNILKDVINIYKKIPLNDFKKIIKTYINDLNEIINNAPRIKEKIVVYYRDIDNKIKINVKNKNPTYLLTSILLKNLINTINTDIYIQRITIDIGTPLIFLEGINYDTESILYFLLPTNTKYIIKEPINKIVNYYDNIKSEGVKKNVSYNNITNEGVIKIVCKSQYMLYIYLTDVHLIKNSSVSSIKALLSIKDDSNKKVDTENSIYCKYYDNYYKKNSEIVKTLLDNIKQYEFEYKKINYNNTTYEIKKFTLELYINEYNKNFLYNPYEFFNIDILKTILKNNDDFLLSLSIDEINTIKYYTAYAYNILSSYITADTFNIDKLLKYFILTTDEYTYYTFREQIYKFYKTEMWTYEKLINTKHYKVLKMYKTIPNKDYKEIFKIYITDLMNIFNKAPKLPKGITQVVYRGVKTNYHYTSQKENVFINPYFSSTSLNFDIALEFAYNTDGFIQKIIINDTIPIIFLDGITFVKGELELLLPINTYYILNKTKDIYYNNPMNHKFEICNNEKYNYKITDMYLIGYTKSLKKLHLFK
jgi:hypothetical protein